MLIWHVAGAVFLFRWIFREPTVDLRFLALGAVLPDVIDLSLGAGFLVDRYARGELWGHSLLFAAGVMTLVMALFRRGPTRKAGMAMAVGILFHLFLDGMWTSTEVFLWPFAGFEFPQGATPFWRQAWIRAVSDPWRWTAEAIGIAYSVWLWRWAGLSDATRRRELVAHGTIAHAEAATPSNPGTE